MTLPESKCSGAWTAPVPDVILKVCLSMEKFRGHIGAIVTGRVLQKVSMYTENLVAFKRQP